MKEIKFRVWDKVDYMSAPFNLKDLQQKLIQFTSDCPVMQYTGLKDKNGKEIYEGDILESNSHDIKGEVKWEQQACQFWIRFTTGRYKELTATFGGEDYRADYFEIIGNIYENPELVNQKQETY